MDEQPLMARLADPAAAHTKENRIAPASAMALPHSGSPEVATLLNAFRVLLLRRFIHFGAAGASAGVGSPSGSPPQDTAMLPASVHVELLTKNSEEIERDDILLQQLCSSLDALTRLAAPATVSSIYLTSAFLHDETSSIASAEARLAARRLRRWALMIAIFGLLFFCSAVMLLIHVDRGRREIQQIEQVRDEYRLVISAVDQRREPDLIAACLNGGAGSERVSATVYEPWCERLRDVEQRMEIARRGLGAWNIVSYRLADVLPVRWLGGADKGPADLSQQRWDASELRASAVMAGFTGFVLPMLLGLLGAFTYVYRDLDRRVRTSTLVSGDGLHGTLRILLGTVLGGLLGVLWTNGQPVKLEGVTLSLAALAFFVGYSVEVVFQTLDTVIAKVASTISH
jgi:hypothetical protein